MNSCLLIVGFLNLIWRASLIVTSKSFLPELIIEKLSHEKFNLHVSHEVKWLDTAEFEGEVPCSFTLVARCRIVLPM